MGDSGGGNNLQPLDAGDASLTRLQLDTLSGNLHAVLLYNGRSYIGQFALQVMPDAATALNTALPTAGAVQVCCTTYRNKHALINTLIAITLNQRSTI
jgi:hypothetical protein